MNIGIKLISAFLLVSSLIGIVGFISYDISKNMLTDSIGSNSNDVANNILDKIDLHLQNNIHLFQMISQEQLLQSYLIKSNEHFSNLEHPQQLIDELDTQWILESKERPSLFMLNLIENDLSDTFRIHQTFFNEQFDYSYIGEVFVTNEYGVNVAQTGRTSDYKQSDELWWQNAKEQGVYVGPIEFDQSADIFARDIAIRVDDSEGNFIGVIKHVINVQEIFSIINDVNEMKKFDSQYFTLLDENFNIIYSTKSNYVDSTFLNPYQNISILEKINKSSDYFISSNPDTSDKLISYTTNNKNIFYTWTLITDFEVSEILAPVDTLRLLLLGMSGIATLFAIIFGMYISRSISKPVLILKNEMNKLEHGEYSKNQIKISNDEIGDLTKSFQKMSKEIENIIELEKKLAVEKEKVKHERLSAIGGIASRLAHDLRNPLSVISNEFEIIKIRDQNPNEKMQKSQGRINRAIDRMTHQIEDVLDFVRTKPLELQNLRICDLLSSVITSLTIPSEIKIHFPKNELFVSVDPNQLRIVFTNLIFNAIQAIDDKGEIQIRINEENNNIIIQIQDSGSGISENDIGKIFEPLYTTKQSGTGLGLVSCKTIIHQHGGKISASNNPTVFTIILPKSIKVSEQIA